MSFSQGVDGAVTGNVGHYFKLMFLSFISTEFNNRFSSIRGVRARQVGRAGREKEGGRGQ
jgi:hypothetical protein